MSLMRLIYVSRMTAECDMQAIQAILEIARKKNSAMDVSGVLCYDPAFFMQCLEGPRPAVNELYASILRDNRHADVLLLEYAEVQERQFAEWSMAFLAARDVNQQLLERYTGSGKFDPYRLTAVQAFNFLVEIVRQSRDLLAT